MARRLKSGWLEGFLSYTEGIKSPRLYRLWAGLSTVSGALGRRVYVHVEGQDLRANLFVLLVGNPGTGKSNAVKHARRFLMRIQTIHLTPTKLTERAFYTALEHSKESHIDLNAPVEEQLYQHSSLNGFIDEFTVFVKRYDTEFMAVLSEIYDSNEIFEYKTQHVGENRVENPWFNLISGVTKKGLKERFSDDALDQGFPARCILVSYVGPQIKVPLFGHNNVDFAKREELSHALHHDLEEITSLRGEYKWSGGAAAELQAWVDIDMEPRPADPRFEHYCNRRIAHTVKICMLSSASRDEEMVIEREDVKLAKEILLEVENYMHHAVEGLSGNPYYEQVRHVRQLVENNYKRTNKATPERVIREMLIREAPIQYIGQILEGAANAAWVATSGDAPKRLFLPADVTKLEKTKKT